MYVRTYEIYACINLYMFVGDAMLKDFIHNLIVFYDENSTRDNVYTITTRKLLLPHVHSFLKLAEDANDDEVTLHNYYILIMFYLHTISRT